MVPAPAIVRLLACFIAHQALGSGAVAAVFEADQLIPTFSTLDSRQCLPSDFLDEAQPASACADLVLGGSLPTGCQGAPKLAVFYVCFATSRGFLTADGTAFDLVAEIQDFTSLSSDQDWNDAALKIYGDCQSESSAGLTERQRAVYTYLCLKWSLFSNCDLEQKPLDEVSALRRARFLSGECPLSPNSLEDLLERATSRTLAECTPAPAPADDPHQQYDAEVSRISCLLQDFTNVGGKLDSLGLKAAIVRELSESPVELQLLNTVVIPCSRKGNTPAPVKTEKFIECWSGIGLYSCVFQEANQVASDFPDDCAISVSV